MMTPLCRQLRTDGTHCGSPSLSGKPWCYFHNRLHRRHRAFRLAASRRRSLMPIQHQERLTLENSSESVKLALSMALNALAHSRYREQGSSE